MFEKEVKEILRKSGIDLEFYASSEPEPRYHPQFFDLVKQITLLAKKTALSALPKYRELTGETIETFRYNQGFNSALSKAEQNIKEAFK